jgi:hypothetical protein
VIDMAESIRSAAGSAAAQDANAVYALGSSQDESARLFREAGLEDVGVEARVQMYPPGNSRRTIRLGLARSMRAQVVDTGLATEAELHELDAAARAPRRPPPRHGWHFDVHR